MSATDHGQLIQYEDERRYFWQTPNVVDMLDLSTVEFRLLEHYYRVGDCWESVRTTARICSIAVGSVVKARRSLATIGLIALTPPAERDDTYTIVPVALWALNVLYFAEGLDAVKERYIGRFPDIVARLIRFEIERERSRGEQAVHDVNAERSPSEQKKTQLKKDDSKKKSVRAPRDERLDHPALVAYREELHLHVAKKSRDDVIVQIGNSEEQLKRWREALVEWRRRGYNPKNLSGLFQVTQHGFRNGSSAKAAQSFDEIELEEGAQ